MGEVIASSPEFGLLWYDNSKKLKAEDKIREASWQFLDQIGLRPRICIVNSATGFRDNTMLLEMTVKVRDHMVKPNYYWLVTHE